MAYTLHAQGAASYRQFQRPFSSALPRSNKMPAVTQPREVQKCSALSIDWTDQTTLTGIAGAVLGVGFGIGVPVFYISRDNKDKETLEYIRELNRKRYEETGEYMSDEEIAEIRVPRWTDNREFADDD